MKKTIVRLCILLAAGALAAACSRGPKQPDRAALVKMMERYLDAVVRHDPTGLPFARDVRFVENIQPAEVGKGLWETATAGPTEFKIYVADPAAGQVGFMGVIGDQGKPALLGARLKVVDGRIAEIDHMVSPLTGELPEGLMKPRAGLVTPLEASERVSREEMLRAANAYYDAIEQSDGSVAPFADECQRRENGVTAANNQDPPPPGPTPFGAMAAFGRMKCAEQLSTGIMGYITDINQRRPVAVDEEMGLVMVYSVFNHDGEPNPLKIRNMPGVTESSNDWGEFTVPAAHIYKIKNGRIHEIEAMAIVGVPYRASDGWNLTRQGLVDLMEDYLAALARHDPSGLPLARDVKLVENTQKIPVGKGLWETASSGPTDFKIYAADPDSGEIGFMGVIGEKGKPTIAAVRLKVADRKITEIDHLVVHGDGPLNPNMSKLRPALLERVPKLERVPREKMREIANAYYEAIVQDDGSVAPFADECERRENGGTSAGDRTPPQAGEDDFSPFRRMTCGAQLSTGVMNYITDINNRRILALDEEKGLAFAFSIFRHDGEPKVMNVVGVPGITERKNDYGPFDLPAAHVFKIRNNRIYEIEAIGYMDKHGIPSGWE
jgi:hypothetical protein